VSQSIRNHQAIFVILDQAGNHIVMRNGMTPCANEEKDFGVFLIHRLVERWGKTAPETYEILNNSNILDGYILRCYGTLHTLGAEYLVNDVTDFVCEKGITI
jgi:hypothetical protein